MPLPSFNIWYGGKWSPLRKKERRKEWYLHLTCFNNWIEVSIWICRYAWCSRILMMFAYVSESETLYCWLFCLLNLRSGQAFYQFIRPVGKNDLSWWNFKPKSKRYLIYVWHYKVLKNRRPYELFWQFRQAYVIISFIYEEFGMFFNAHPKQLWLNFFCN